MSKRRNYRNQWLSAPFWFGGIWLVRRTRKNPKMARFYRTHMQVLNQVISISYVSWVGSTPRFPVPASLQLLALQLKPRLLRKVYSSLWRVVPWPQIWPMQYWNFTKCSLEEQCSDVYKILSSANCRFAITKKTNVKLSDKTASCKTIPRWR